MKLEEGMYVRTKEGIIGKYNVVKEWIDVPTLNGYYEIKEIEREYIDNELYRNYVVVNASHNIIDLIQVGDYVNGLRVEKSKYGKLYTSYTYMGGDIGLQQETYTTFLKDYEEDDVYSILTREQFENIKYEVE